MRKLFKGGNYSRAETIRENTVVQILVHSHFELVSSLLALDATEPVSEPVTQMAVELINIHFSTAKEMSVKVTFFFM